MLAGRIRARLSPVAKFFRREGLWVVLLALASIAVHAKYRLTGFGEQDAARLARDAIIWHLKHQITSSESTYRMHTSPGYIHLLKLALDHGLRIARLPWLMNWLSVVLGTGAAVALYALFRQYSAPRYAALAIFLYSMTPGFWLGNVYGMPTIPALCGFALSVLLFVRAARLPELRTRWLPALTLGSLICQVWAIAFKADLVLCTGIFVVVALSARGRRLIMLGLASFVVFGAVFLSNRYSAMMLTLSPDDKPTTREFLKDWSAQFPFKLAALLDAPNHQTIVNCAGAVLFFVTVLALLAALIGGGRRCWLATAALIWGVPPILFWALLFGNHSRHSVFGMAPLFLITAHFIFTAVNERTLRALALALCLVIASYFSDTKDRGTVLPASNVLDSTEWLQAVTSSYHLRGFEVAKNPSLKRVVVGAGVVAPYLDFEVFAAAKHPIMLISWEMRDGPQITAFAHNTNRHRQADLVRTYRHDGYVPLSQ